jgi:DNA polymerase
MSDVYHQLLDAAIQHLHDLKARRVRFVSVSPQALADLSQSRPKVAQPNPSSAVAPVLPASPTPVARPAPSSSVETVLRPPPSVLVPPASVLSPQAKAAAFAELRQRAMACVKCSNLAAARKNVVFGVGDINATLMFVGEAPGADEDAQGEPFVGAAGQLLTKIIQTMGLSRSSVYIANILKCRPDTPGQRSGNRKPTAEEMQTCIPFLHEQIDLIGPRVLVALGSTAVEGLLGKTAGITRLRGQWQMYRGIPLMPTYHPAYLLHNQALSEKRRVWEDMLQVMGRLEMPISEKQRNFFPKPVG